MKLLIFLGSVRKTTPPKPARLGKRVAKACERSRDRASGVRPQPGRGGD